MNMHFLNHWSNAIQFRTALWLEILRVKKSGISVPPTIKSLIWKEPQNQEEYIWLLRFTNPEDSITVIDIGGNSGYWAQAFLSYFPNSFIYGFEPVEAMFKAYTQRFETNKNVRVFNVALGSRQESRQIHVAEGYGLSSFHTYSDSLQDKNAIFIDHQDVNVDVLDHYTEFIDFKKTSKVVIKVDVQGFETKVVQGGLAVFKMADLVIMECSFINEFKDEKPTFGELVTLLRTLDLHPIYFGSFDKKRSAAAFERNVLFVKSKYFNLIWNK